MNTWWKAGSSTVSPLQQFAEQRRMWLGKLVSKLVPFSFEVPQTELLTYFYPPLAPNLVSKDMFINLLLSRINLLSTLS